MIFSVSDVGKYGVLTSQPGAETPFEAWTSARNVRFKPGMAEKLSGGLAIFPGAPISAYKLVPYTGPTGAAGWILAGADKVYAFEGGTYTNITRQTVGVDVDYTAEPEARWSGGFFNGKAVLYNGLDVPQYWNLLPATKLVALSGWPSGMVASVLRPFKNYLIAGNVTKGGTNYSNMVKWSHPADAGAMPISWDETDPTLDAGEQVLAETPGYVVDTLPLRDTNIIYKDDSIWTMRVIGGVFVMRFEKLSTQAGMPLKDMCVEFEVGKHLVFTGDDLIVHDGVQVKSVLGRFNRAQIVPINTDKLTNSFMTHVPKLREVWINYATSSAADGVVDQALIWNYETNSLTTRDMGSYTALAVGVADSTELPDDTWDASTGVWSTDVTTWGGAAAGAIYGNRDLLGQRTDRTVLLEEQQPGIDGVAFTAEIVREGLAPAFKANQPDSSSMKFCRRVWPRLYGLTGTVVEVTIGSAMRLGDPTVWQTPQFFTIGTSEFLDCRVTGRVFAIKFRSTTLATWGLFGYDMDVDRVGGF